MPPKQYFIAGLPRSGSTLLSAILSQNPAFEAGISTSLVFIFESLIKSLTTTDEFNKVMNDKQRLKILEGLITNFYHDKQDKKIIFDKGRSWPKWLDTLVKIYPDVKIMCTVRNVAWVIDSFERLYKDRPWAYSGFWESPDAHNTAYSRAEGAKKLTNVFGNAYSSLSDGLSGKYSDHILLVDYDVLTSYPEDTLKCIYMWLEEPYYEGHDFNNVDFTDVEYDKKSDVEGLHTVRKKVEKIERKTILPPDLFSKLEAMNKMWRIPTNARAISISKSTNAPVNTPTTTSQKKDGTKTNAVADKKSAVDDEPVQQADF